MRVLRAAVVVVCLCVAGCGAATRSASSGPAEIDPIASWPKDAGGLVTHLNTWNSKELEAYERVP
jgi:hypothetical protein